MSTSAGSAPNPVKIEVIHKLIASGQTIVDVSPGGAEWLDAVFARHSNMRALFYARPASEIDAFSSTAADQTRAVHQGSGNSDGFDLDADALREGIRHIHYLHIGSTTSVRRVLKGAARLLSHSHIDFIQFPLDTFDLFTAQTISQSLSLAGYSIFEIADESQPSVALKNYSLHDLQREHKVVEIIAIHERLVPSLSAGETGLRLTVDPLEVAAKRGIKVRGVIHVGTSDAAAELEFYRLMDLPHVLLIEPDPQAFARLAGNYSHLAAVALANCALADSSSSSNSPLTGGLSSLNKAVNNGSAPRCQPAQSISVPARVLDHCSFTVRESTNPVVEALSLLSPYDIDKPKVRIGPHGDGGYILVDDLSPDQAIVSYGISTEYSFDRELAERGHDVYMFDHTIDGIDAASAKMHFFREGVAGTTDTALSLFSIEDHLSRHGITGDRLILKMDVEGAEFDALSAISDECLARFEQIVIEAHGLQCLQDLNFQKKFCIAFRKINRLFTLFHVHANNCDGQDGLYVVSGLPVSSLVELSYVRSAKVQRRPSQTLYPTALDFPNSLSKDKLLWFFPFLPTYTSLSDFTLCDGRVGLFARLRRQWANGIPETQPLVGADVPQSAQASSGPATMTLDALLEERQLVPECFNALVLEPQGGELRVLKGALGVLRHIDLILTQLQFEETGQGCDQIDELDDLLAGQGFRRAYTWSTERAWADVLYIKAKLGDEKPIEAPNVLTLLHPGGDAGSTAGSIYSPASA